MYDRLEALYAEAAVAKDSPEKDREYLRLRKALQEISLTYGFSQVEYERYLRRLVDSMDY